MELSLPAEQARPKFYRPLRSDRRKHLPLHARRRLLRARCYPDRLRRSEVVSFQLARRAASAMDPPLPRLGRVFVAVAIVAFPWLETRLQYSRLGGMGRLLFRISITAYFDWQNRIDHSAWWNLFCLFNS